MKVFVFYQAVRSTFARDLPSGEKMTRDSLQATQGMVSATCRWMWEKRQPVISGRCHDLF